MGLWFWLKKSHSEKDSIYESKKITLNNLNYKPSLYFGESSTFRLFKELNFSVEIVGFYENHNQIPSCTLYLTDDEKIRISIVVDQHTLRTLFEELQKKENQHLRFCITDNKSLEECCKSLLIGDYKRSTFVKNIDSFWIGKITFET